MKRIISFLCAFALALALFSCQDTGKQAEEVAEKLDGTWFALQDSPIGRQIFIYEFDHLGSNAGSCDYYLYISGEPTLHFSFGTYGVSLSGDGEIEMTYLAKIHTDGSVERLESAHKMTLSYTYKDGELVLSDGTHTLIPFTGDIPFTEDSPSDSPSEDYVDTPIEEDHIIMTPENEE